MIVLDMLGMALSLTLQGRRPAAENTEHFKVPTVDEHFTGALRPAEVSVPTGEMLVDNVKVYEPLNSQPVGSLILIMGHSGDLSWTMTQWWYLDPTWSPSDQDWCKDPPHNCFFSDEDKVAVQHLRNNLRIVDAVGKIVLDTGGSTWYNYERWGDGTPVSTDLERAVANVFQLIEHEYTIVGDYRRIAIAGMSQGADLALEVGIRFPHQLGMVMSQRGVLMPSRRLGNQSLAARLGTPFVLTAGDADEFWSLATFKGSCSSLQRMQTPVYFKTYPGLYHGSFSKPEWKLINNIFLLMLSSGPKADQIAHLDWYSSCVDHTLPEPHP